MNYVELADNGDVILTRCMKCMDTIATLKERGERMVLTPWSHYLPYQVILDDGSYASLPACKDCHSRITEEDYPDFERQLRYGWVRQQTLVYQGQEGATGAIIDAATMARSKHIVRKA